ncbi:MAG: PIN domain-containing protein [Bryobacterales bacterium]|nr:PIN domain-containing protein [Bryobacterales bacterium]MBV9396644.1 PIN domain-containing protein [Bryobacterales bacterium]
MGLIADTSALVTAERAGHSVAETLEKMRDIFGETEIGLSVVTVVELTHGIQRAKIEDQRTRRQAFVEDARAAMTVHSLTDEIAQRAGTISGQLAEKGISVPLADLLIGSTALHLGYGVLTENTRHFEVIPGLVVRRL